MDGVGVCQLHYRAVYMGLSCWLGTPTLCIYITSRNSWTRREGRQCRCYMTRVHALINVRLTLSTLSVLTERCLLARDVCNNHSDQYIRREGIS